MSASHHPPLILIISLVWLAACQVQQPAVTDAASTQAAMFCVQQGGSVDVQQDLHGREIAYCVVSENSRCALMVFYEGLCGFSGAEPVMPGEAPLTVKKVKTTVIDYLQEKYPHLANWAAFTWQELDTSSADEDWLSVTYITEGWTLLIRYGGMMPVEDDYAVVVTETGGTWKLALLVDASGNVEVVSE